MNINTVNNFVACEPFKTHSNQVGVKSGFAKAESREALISLKVVFNLAGNHNFYVSKGDTVWVAAEKSTTKYAQTEYTVDGVKFVLILASEILMVGHEDRLAAAYPTDTVVSGIEWSKGSDPSTQLITGNELKRNINE